jgi:hypothetical protein
MPLSSRKGVILENLTRLRSLLSPKVIVICYATICYSSLYPNKTARASLRISFDFFFHAVIVLANTPQDKVLEHFEKQNDLFPAFQGLYRSRAVER